MTTFSGGASRPLSAMIRRRLPVTSEGRIAEYEYRITGSAIGTAMRSLICRSTPLRQDLSGTGYRDRYLLALRHTPMADGGEEFLQCGRRNGLNAPYGFDFELSLACKSGHPGEPRPMFDSGKWVPAGVTGFLLSGRVRADSSREQSRSDL